MRKIAMLGSLLVLAMLLVAACGGGDDDDDDDAGSPPSGGGEFGSYASDLSTAIDNFVQTLPGLMNQQQFAAGNFDSLAEPYSDLADDLERARPPDALAEYHAALVEVIRATADAFEEGGIEALGRLDELASFPVPSDDVLEEFAREGGDIPACQNIGFADAS